MNIFCSKPKTGINCSYGPVSLYDNCLYWITKGLIKGNSALLKALENIELPSKIGYAIMKCYLREEHVLDNKILKVFKIPAVSRLKKVNLRECKIEDNNDIIYLLNFNLRELHLEDCFCETGGLENFLHHLNENGTHLEVFSCSRSMTEEIFSHAFEKINGVYAFESKEYVLQTPNLKKLILKDLIDPPTAFIIKLLKPLRKLVYLDLSWAQGNTIDCSCLLELHHLQSLILKGVELDEFAITSISKLHNLQYLDLSCSPIPIPIGFLIKTLSKLNFLDMSFTNTPDDCFDLKEGFECRKNNPFQFFGADDCSFPSEMVIPAIMISNCDGNNYLNAMWKNVGDPKILSFIVRENIESKEHLLLDHLTVELLELACEILDKATIRESYDTPNLPLMKGITFAVNICCKALQNSASYDFMTFQMKKRLVTALVKRLKKDNHYFDEEPVYELLFLISAKDLVYCMDVMMDFIEFIVRKILVKHLYWDLSRIMQHFFKIMNDDQKQRLINRGVMEDIVKSVTTTGNIDILFLAWEFLFYLFANSTSLVENNGQRFLVRGGVELFVFSLMTYKKRNKLPYLALHLFFNLAGRKSLAVHLIKENILHILLEVLNGINALAFDISRYDMRHLISFLIAGVIVQILSHGIEILTIEKLELEDIFRNLIFAIKNFNNEQFLPAFRTVSEKYPIESVTQLLGRNHFPCIRYWAVRSIAAFYSDKEDINLLIQQGKRIDVFEEIAAIEDCPESLKKCCLYVIDKIKNRL